MDLSRIYKRARRGIPSAQNTMGNILYKFGGEGKYHVRAAEWYKRASSHGHAEATFRLGMMYAFGEGMPKDEKMAIKLLKKAAKKGNREARKFLNMYLFDLGIEKLDLGKNWAKLKK